MEESAESIQVYARVRPKLTGTGDTFLATCPTGLLDQFTPDTKYRFTQVFDKNATQDHVYLSCGKSLVEKVTHGYHAALLAYGQSGSGKTFTTCGDAEKNVLGLVHMIARDLMSHCRSDEGKRQGSVLSLSIVQCYLGKIYDLLINDPEASRVRIRELPLLPGQKRPTTYLESANNVPLDTHEVFLQKLSLAIRQRAVRKTNLNDASTRAHMVVIFTLTTRSTQSNFYLVDLSGSESVLKAGTEGEGRRETGAINKSLFHLQQLVHVLSNPQLKEVPVFRNSSLTRVIQPALDGNCCTSFIVTLYDEIAHRKETVSSMKFAEGLQKIVNRASVNIRMDVEQLRTMNANLLNRVKLLEQMLEEAHGENKKLRLLLQNHGIQPQSPLSVILSPDDLDDLEDLEDDDDDGTGEEDDDNEESYTDYKNDGNDGASCLDEDDAKSDISSVSSYSSTGSHQGPTLISPSKPPVITSTPLATPVESNKELTSPRPQEPPLVGSNTIPVTTLVESNKGLASITSPRPKDPPLVGSNKTPVTTPAPLTASVESNKGLASVISPRPQEPLLIGSSKTTLPPSIIKSPIPVMSSLNNVAITPTRVSPSTPFVVVTAKKSSVFPKPVVTPKKKKKHHTWSLNEDQDVIDIIRSLYIKTDELNHKLARYKQQIRAMRIKNKK